MSCFDLAHAPVATTAHAAATGPVSMSTRPDPEGSDTVEIATRRCPRLRVVWDLRDLTHQQDPRLRSLPARRGPVTVHPTLWGVGPRIARPCRPTDSQSLIKMMYTHVFWRLRGNHYLHLSCSSLCLTLHPCDLYKLGTYTLYGPLEGCQKKACIACGSPILLLLLFLSVG